MTTKDLMDCLDAYVSAKVASDTATKEMAPFYTNVVNEKRVKLLHALDAWRKEERGRR